MPFHSAIAVAQRVARSLNGGPIRYTRGGTYVDIALAGRGRSQFTVGSGQVLVQVESRDFLIETAALILDGQLVLPERGDVITETMGGRTYTYELLDLGDEPSWRYSDEYRLQLRVHTKLTDAP